MAKKGYVSNAYRVYYTGYTFDKRYENDYKQFLQNIHGTQGIYFFRLDFQPVFNPVLLSSVEDLEYVQAIFSDFEVEIEKISTDTILSDSNHLDMLGVIQRLSKGGAQFNDIDLKKLSHL